MEQWYLLYGSLTVLIMNFDNEQAAVSQKYVVCVRDSHTGIQIEARRSKLSSF